jgi:high affinity Mn2+ porin
MQKCYSLYCISFGQWLNNRLIAGKGHQMNRKVHTPVLELLAVLMCGLLISPGAIADHGMVPGSGAIQDPGEELGSTNASATMETWNLHGQMTYVMQGHPAFTAPYSGQNSLDPARHNNQTTDVTLFAGLRLGQSSELYVNPEYDQGFGLSNTLGVAGYPSGEAYKVGAHSPYLRLPRAFYRQVINLGGAMQPVEPGANQLGGSVAADNVTVTVGKFSVVDVFDTNTYAHDPRADFLNWSIVDAGAFDYAADAWGFTYGAAVEWTQSWWTLRGGLFDLSKVPNTTKLDRNFSQYEWVGEWEMRHQWLDHPGKLKLLAYINRANMGGYRDAVGLGLQMASVPDTALVRHSDSSRGFSVNAEQEVAPDLGVFARASLNDGSKEAFDFTEINRSVSVGLSLRGNRWGRQDDTMGAALAVNGLSAAARDYFAAGGIGILIGDGRLNYGPERIGEIYYKWQAGKHCAFGLDYQHIANPAYNADRGPVQVFGARLHLEY